MGSRRERSFRSLSFVTLMAVACLLVGCVPPPDPVAEQPEPAAHKKEHHHHEGEEGADSPCLLYTSDAADE